MTSINNSQGVVEFDLQGHILNANENFLNLMSWRLEELKGQHYRVLVGEEAARSSEFTAFWSSVARGESRSGRFKRFSRDGRELWVQAMYSPIRDSTGKVFKILKFATDVTEEETLAQTSAGVMAAIDHSQGIVEFDPKGNIQHANENFLGLTGWTLNELKGQHYGVLVGKEAANSSEFKQFWANVAAGEAQSGKFKRFARDGRELWVQVTYNPIVDSEGKVFKIVKFASDITDAENARMEAERLQQQQAEDQSVVVSNLARGLNSLAEGDLTSQIEISFPGEYEKLRADFNTAVSRLRDVMTTVVSNAHGIQNGVGEISQASDDLSRRTENQAASLEETAAALDEATTAVKETASSANQANELVGSTRREAETSGEIVRQAVSAMSEIERSSSEINQIIGVIDEIAFQTNLLALNAGVEAARAGDAGRGFAVVASEVRALAQRSSDAAKEIKTLISASTEHVGSGVELVGKAGTALQEIVGRVAEVSNLVSSIAGSAQEQSRGLAEINSAVNQMDQVTQQNAAMVEQSTAASHSLKQEADQLLELISHFRTGMETAGGVVKSPNLPVAKQQQRAASFAANHGSAALDMGGNDGWDEF